MSVRVFLLHVLLSWLVVYVLDYGLLGVAHTLSFSWWLLILLNGLYIILGPTENALYCSLEAWYNQGLVLISGMNYLNWDLQFKLGLSAAASVRVSNQLGAAHPRVAIISVIVVNGISILISVVFCAIILICREAFCKLFTSDSEVIEEGICWGMIFAVLVQTATLIILTARTNWDAEVKHMQCYRNCLLHVKLLNYLI
ncbi:Protein DETOXIFICATION 41 [Glycine max]|nr:Protein DETOXIFICATION 41 [Glycine max]